METLLFARTFYIVGGMLLVTSLTAKLNKTFETKIEFWATIISTFGLLFAVMFCADQYPLNIILVALFAGATGWMIGPTIEHFGTRFKMKRHLKDQGVELKKGEKPSPDALQKFESTFDVDRYHAEWQNIIFQTMFATALAVFATASLVFTTDYDFGFLGQFLFIALIMLIVMGFMNALFFKSQVFSLMRAYFGAVIFTLYLLYDFNRLEKFANDESWAAAIDISVNIYLDIINLFLDLLEILSD